MKDFFISYNELDRDWAVWIAWLLESEGYSVEIQAWDFLPGDNFVLKMHAGSNSKRTLAVLSPNFLNADFPQAEWAAAYRQDPKGINGKLMLVRVANCKPEGLLGPIVYIDLVGLNESAAAKMLLNGVKRERMKPTEPPMFPGLTKPAFPPPSPDIADGWTFASLSCGEIRAHNEALCREYARMDPHDLLEISSCWRVMASAFTQATKHAGCYHSTVLHDERVDRFTKLLETALSDRDINGVNRLGSV